MGKEFELERTELLAFVKEQQEEQRREKEEIRQKEIEERENRRLEREQRKEELELEKELLREKEEMERNLLREMEKIEEARREHELEMKRLELEYSKQAPASSSARPSQSSQTSVICGW